MKDNQTIGRCANCRYSNLTVDENDNKSKLECRRYAPRILCGSGEGWSSQQYPFVRLEDWCGEYKNKDEPVITIESLSEAWKEVCEKEYYRQQQKGKKHERKGKK